MKLVMEMGNIEKIDVAKKFIRSLNFPITVSQACLIADTNPQFHISGQTVRKYAGIFAANGDLDVRAIGFQRIMFGWRAMPNSKVNQDGRA